MAEEKTLHVSYRVLDHVAYRQALLSKIIEEAHEVATCSSRGELLEELADLHDSVNALREYEEMTEDELRNASTRKTYEKGAFTKRHYIEYVDLADDSEWISVFRSQPEKYNEIP